MRALIASVLLLSACGPSAQGPAFAPAPKPAEGTLVYFYRPDAAYLSGHVVAMGANPVPTERAEALAAALQEGWDKGMEDVTVGQLLAAAAEGAVQGAAEGAFLGIVEGTTGIDVSPLLEAAKKLADDDKPPPPENCYQLKRGGYFATVVPPGQSLLLTYNSGYNVKFEAFTPEAVPEEYVRVTLDEEGFSVFTKLEPIPGDEGGIEIASTNGPEHCETD